MVVGKVCGGGAIGKSSAGGTGNPLRRFDELCGCDSVGSGAVEWPFIAGCSEYLMNSLSPWLAT